MRTVAETMLLVSLTIQTVIAGVGVWVLPFLTATNVGGLMHIPSTIVTVGFAVGCDLLLTRLAIRGWRS